MRLCCSETVPAPFPTDSRVCSPLLRNVIICAVLTSLAAFRPSSPADAGRSVAGAQIITVKLTALLQAGSISNG